MRDTPETRDEFIGHLVELLVFLMTHPDVPVPGRYSHTVIPLDVDGTDAEKCAQVDRIAQLLGAPIIDRADTAGHYSTERCFGNIVISAVAITEERMRQYHAVMSYQDCVIPDPDTAVSG